MNVLIACEESQRVCIEFRKLGHRAFSCDTQECSGGHPEWHINEDVLPLLDGDCSFKTQDGETHRQDGEWDLIIAHPPCTYLTITGNRWFDVEKYGEEAVERARLREEAVDFFMKFVEAKCKRIAIENPVGCMSTRYRIPDCIIQPWEFGDPFMKKTCLWLKNLPQLYPTDKLELEPRTELGQYMGALYYATDENGKKLPWNDPRTRVERSKTYFGVARAMALQWSQNLPPIIDDADIDVQKKMNVLVACEDSQAVCAAFRAKGHRAFSCDFHPCGGSYPEWHIQGDVLDVINGRCAFETQDGTSHVQLDRWDLIIAHPPCAYMAKGGAVRLFRKEEKYYPSYGTFQMVNVDRLKQGMLSRDFFMRILNADCDKIAIENPVPMSIFMLPEPTQIVQPYQFGDPFKKQTCLWLKGLSKLEPTDVVEPTTNWRNGGSKKADGTPRESKTLTDRRTKMESRSFPGIAKAMAEAWG